MKTILVVLALATITSSVRAANGVTPGQFVIEPATLICLGFEWDITGDENRNATVEVSYRVSGKSAWMRRHAAAPHGRRADHARALHGARPFCGKHPRPSARHGVRGPFDDEGPGRRDGNGGPERQGAHAGEPKAAAGGRTIHVYPLTWPANRPKENPNFTGLMAAYNGYVGTGDWNVVALHKAEPGDTFLVHAGLYKGDRHNYVDPYGLTFDGTYLLTAKGTAEKPIVIKSAGDGEVIFDGDGAFRLFDVMGSAYHIFDGITFRNTEVAFWAGVKEVAGAWGSRSRTAGSRASGSASRPSLPARRVFISRTTCSSGATIATARSAGRAPASMARIPSTATTRSRSTGRATRSRTTPWRSSTTASGFRRTAFPIRTARAGRWRSISTTTTST